MWIDVGGRESDRWQHRYAAGYGEMRRLLEEKGCEVGGFVEPEAVHHETAWAKRLPAALRFLFE